MYNMTIFCRPKLGNGSLEVIGTAVFNVEFDEFSNVSLIALVLTLY